LSFASSYPFHFIKYSRFCRVACCDSGSKDDNWEEAAATAAASGTVRTSRMRSTGNTPWDLLVPTFFRLCFVDFCCTGTRSWVNSLLAPPPLSTPPTSPLSKLSSPSSRSRVERSWKFPRFCGGSWSARAKRAWMFTTGGGGRVVAGEALSSLSTWLSSSLVEVGGLKRVCMFVAPPCRVAGRRFATSRPKEGGSDSRPRRVLLG